MKSPTILLLTPPLTQLNTPYPATAYLKGFLKQEGYSVKQGDLGIELILKLLSKQGLTEIFAQANSVREKLSPNSQRILHLESAYLHTIDPIINFLQNKDTTLAHRICSGEYLPEASRFATLQDMEWAFGSMGIQDRARFFATLYIDDIADLITEAVSSHFGFSRYAERLALSATSFAPLEKELRLADSLIDQVLLDLLEKHIQATQPEVVAFSIPFPGNLYGALKCGQYLKKYHPSIKVLLGGGYVNTELRQLKDPNIFNYADFIMLDDGESPFLQFLRYLEGLIEQSELKRTFLCQQGKVVFQDNASCADVPHRDVGTPDYSDLLLDKYLSVIEVPNPMHRLWSDGRWNKMTLAHGCYWKRCTFCDVTLDYIKRYDEAPVSLLADRIEQIIEQTGQTGFHFVDEAAPPALLKELSIEILRRNITITWWTNIRFERTFSEDLCRLLAAAGCIAVSGGLEVASDRILKKIRKGVSIKQVAKVADDFTKAGILLHAYLMYGFPTQTVQETVDSLEAVRQLFESGVVQSGYWHQFSMTAHSPIGQNPAAFGVQQIGPEEGTFAQNDLLHSDPEGCDHTRFSPGLRKSLYNFMHGVGIDLDVSSWFDFKVPQTTLAENLVEEAIDRPDRPDIDRLGQQVLWLGNKPELSTDQRKKKGKKVTRAKLTFFDKAETWELTCSLPEARWLQALLPQLSYSSEEKHSLQSLKENYPSQTGMGFDSLLQSTLWQELRKNGLLLLR
ncbi:MAG: radical SAM protein [SAR324 cluster bacterium]|uniref:Radical SAM protein n=1 Tax=SAR324 cluster bacterium TaxID=2024889 RepID=A0A2A4SSZ2_9DELT|nr:MAG: radical SAM protein [SAR324 cluster bacterium]